MGVLPASLTMQHTCDCWPWRSKEGTGFPGTGVTCCEPPCRCRNRTPVLYNSMKCLSFTAEQSL